MIYAVIHSRHRGVTILFTDILCEQVVSFSLFTARHWFNKEEEHALQRHNSAYYHVNPIEDIVCNIYAPAMLDEPDCLSLSAAIIHQELKKRFPAVLRNCTPIQLAQILTATGISRQHTRLGNVYLVKKVDLWRPCSSLISIGATLFACV